MKDGSIVPVVAVSAATGVGIARMLDLMAKYFPSPAHNGLYWAGKDPRTGEDITRICKDDQPFSAVRLQDHRRPVRRQAVSVAASSPACSAGRRHALQPRQGQDRKVRRHLHPARQEAGRQAIVCTRAISCAMAKLAVHVHRRHALCDACEPRYLVRRAGVPDALHFEGCLRRQAGRGRQGVLRPRAA